MSPAEVLGKESRVDICPAYGAARDESGTSKDFGLSPLQLSEKRVCTCERILFWLLWILLFFTIAVGVAILTLYLVFQPKAPQFEIQQAHVDNLTLAATASTSAAFLLNGRVNVTALAKNPNKVTILYQYINVSALFENVTLGNTTVPSFVQSPQSTTLVNISLAVNNFPLSLAIGPSMLSAFGSGSLPIQVSVIAGGRIELFGLASPMATVELGCNLVVAPSNGTVTNSNCRVTSVRLFT